MNKRSAEESKKNIVAAARTVFAKQGYAQASMRTIAQSAGISVGGLYLHFRNKDELYLTFTREWMKELNDLTMETLRGVDSPPEAVGAFISVSVEFARRNKETIILQGMELGFSFGIDLKKEFSRERRKILAEIVRRGIDTGVFRECDADETAKIIFSILRGYVISLVIDEDALFAPEECVDMVLQGLLRRNNG